jgi:ribosomal 50S subunit-associated protein YjgA (DUF615 family)
MPSQQNSRQKLTDLSRDYLSAVPVNSGNNSKVENYKRIKQEEAIARAQLMAPRLEAAGSGIRHSDLKLAAAHRRNPSLLGQKYKPSEIALA